MIARTSEIVRANGGQVLGVAMLVDRWGPEGGIRTGFFKGSCYIPKGPLALSR